MSDLISRQAAIDAFYDVARMIDNYVKGEEQEHEFFKK